MPEFRPMKSAHIEDPAALRYPGLVSPKLNGIRCVIRDGKPLSYTGKPIPNRYITKCLSDFKLEGLDGELVVGPPNAYDALNKSSSGVMSRDGEPDFKLYAFDYHDMPAGTPYCLRHEALINEIQSLQGQDFPVEMVLHSTVSSVEDFLLREKLYVEAGYEGIIYRATDGLYKYGRSTAKQQWSMKLKRFKDAEAKIIGFKEEMENANDEEVNAIGLTKRGHSKDGMIPKGRLGAFVCETVADGVHFHSAETFGLASGFNDEFKVWAWNNRDALAGQFVIYQFFMVGINGVPLNPRYIALRDPIDFDAPSP